MQENWISRWSGTFLFGHSKPPWHPRLKRSSHIRSFLFIYHRAFIVQACFIWKTSQNKYLKISEAIILKTWKEISNFLCNIYISFLLHFQPVFECYIWIYFNNNKNYLHFLNFILTCKNIWKTQSYSSTQKNII